MDMNVVKEFIKLAKDEGVSELKVEDKNLKIAVSFNTSSAPVIHSLPQASVVTSTASDTPKSQNFHELKSPFVGTFYSSSSPDKAPYVKVGDKVSKGQILCILEAMKIMNEIEADVSGEIVEVCVDNESLVEFGQPLFKIKK